MSFAYETSDTSGPMKWNKKGPQYLTSFLHSILRGKIDWGLIMLEYLLKPLYAHRVADTFSRPIHGGYHHKLVFKGEWEVTILTSQESPKNNHNPMSIMDPYNSLWPSSSECNDESDDVALRAMIKSRQGPVPDPHGSNSAFQNTQPKTQPSSNDCKAIDSHQLPATGDPTISRKCYCGKDTEMSELTCGECVAKSTNRYIEFKKKGLCPKCGKNEPTDGLIVCEKCLAMERSKSDKAREEGNCTRCRKKQAQEGRAMCEECAIKKIETRQKTKARKQ